MQVLEARNLGVYLDEDEDAEDRAQERALRQTEGVTAPARKALPVTSSKTTTADAGTLGYYDNQRKALVAEREKTTKQYDQYDKSLEAIDPFIKSIDPKEKQQAIGKLEAKIGDLSRENDKEMERIQKILSDPQRAEEGREKLHAFNARNLQIGTLKDYLSVVKGEKALYDKEGKLVSEFEKADYIVPKGMKLVKDPSNPDSKDLYLLKEGETLNNDNKADAKKAFERAEPEMSSVKNLVKTNRGIELGSVDQQIQQLSREISQLQAASSRTPPPKTMGRPPDSASREGDEAADQQQPSRPKT